MDGSKRVTLGVVNIAPPPKTRVRELIGQKECQLHTVIMWEAETFNRSILRLFQLPPDLLIIHTSRYESEFITFLKTISQRFGNTKTLLFAPLPSAILARRVLSLGLDSYVNSERPDNLLLDAISSVLVDACWFDKDFMLAMKSPASRANDLDMGIEFHLSNRDQEILRLLASGHSNSQIAASLNISQRTVRYHIRKVCDKLGVDSPVQAIIQLNIELID